MPRRPQYTTDYIRPLFPLDLNCQVRFRINTARGQVTGFVVQLELEIADRLYPVVRYDSAHGQPHRDTLDADGNVIAKDWLPYSFDAALAEARRDMLANWQQYREEFLKRMP